jgi:hypothetical protein
MKVPLPAVFCEKIADAAHQRCRIYAIQRGWKSADKLYPVSFRGIAGVGSSVHYLLYQDAGIRPFLMTALEGKVISLKDNTGTTHFVHVKNVGSPGLVRIPGDPAKPKNLLYTSRAARPGLVYREQRWKHPGIDATHFMETALRKSVKNSKPMIRNYFKSILSGGQK